MQQWIIVMCTKQNALKRLKLITHLFIKNFSGACVLMSHGTGEMENGYVAT